VKDGHPGDHEHRDQRRRRREDGAKALSFRISFRLLFGESPFSRRGSTRVCGHGICRPQDRSPEHEIRRPVGDAPPVDGLTSTFRVVLFSRHISEASVWLSAAS